MAESLRNWAGNYTYRATRLHAPGSISELQRIVAHSHKARALGSRHSFNDIADSPADLISLARLDSIIEIDPERQTVTIEAGMRYTELGQALHSAGFALHNLASLPHISVIGACATGTHGSGNRNGGLATAIAAIEFVTATGDLVTLAREQHGDTFLGAVVALGGLGIAAKVTLDIQSTFSVQQQIYERLPLAQLERNFDALTSSAYSVSLFTDWSSDTINQVWFKRQVGESIAGALDPITLGATHAISELHPIGWMSAESCTPQLDVAGPWHERLPHFRPEFTPSGGDELQSEYIVGRSDAWAAISAIAALHNQITPLLLTSEIRTIAADQLWLSPYYQRDSVALHFTWKPRWPEVQALLPTIEAALAPFGARPHWGKLFTLDPAQLPALYPRMADFRNLLTSYDPHGKFRNAFLDRTIFAT